MHIVKEGLFFLDYDEGGVSVGMDSERLDECIEEVNRRGATGVFGSPTFGFRQDNVDFLARIAHVDWVWFWDVELNNIDGLYSLANLRYFGVHPKRPDVDFAKFPKLNLVVWIYKPGDTGLSKLTHLSTLNLWRYKGRGKTFEDVQLPTCLENLQISWANVTSLKGLPHLEKLKKLEIHYCRSLGDLAGLRDIAPNLEHMVVTGCGKLSINSIDVSEFPLLRHAAIMGKIVSR